MVMVFLVFANACTFEAKKISAGQDSAPVDVPINVMTVPDAIPKYEKRTRAGNPIEYEVLGKSYQVLSKSQGYQEIGMASWYGTKFHGRKTANGETYNMYAMTAAHKTLPIPSYVQVKNLNNRRSIIVRINDRGPFHENRIIDLSYTAAVKLDIQKMGVGKVEVIALGFDEPKDQITQRNIATEKETGVEFYFLQIGSFSSLDKAQKLQQTLPSSEPLFYSTIVPEQSRAEVLYKLRLGPYNSTDKSNEASEKLWQIGITDVMFIQTIIHSTTDLETTSIP
jgi:rare lipoprotein A